jgi:hypothetical protein
MQRRKVIQTAHRWLGLALVAQVVLWMASGVIMSWIPIEVVRGENAASAKISPELQVTSYFPPGGVIADFGPATEIEIRTWIDRPVYLVTGDAGRALYDADTGARLSPIGEAEARRVAEFDFTGDGEIDEAKLMRTPPGEYRGVTPVWRVDFNDANKTRLYISPETGEVVARRNSFWRLYDFFWMLHIMDYNERENFNNPLIRTFAATGFVFALSGLWLVIVRVRNGRYGADARSALRRSPPGTENT